MVRTSRMTASERRTQLINVGRSLFAKEGFEAVSVEEIAAAAKISKPIVYEHFGGKEGLYAVVIDREMQSLTAALNEALHDTSDHPRQLVEKAALAFLTYIEKNSEGFKVLVRDSPINDATSSFNSLLGDVSTRVEYLLLSAFKHYGIPTKSAQYYAQMLVGMIVFTGQYWSEHRKVSKEVLASYMVNLAWRGLSRMDANPSLIFESSASLKQQHKDDRRQLKEQKRLERLQQKEKSASSVVPHVEEDSDDSSSLSSDDLPVNDMNGELENTVEQ